MTIMTSSSFRTTYSPIFTPPAKTRSSWSPQSKPLQKPPHPSGGSCFHYISEVSNEPKSENGVGSHRADLQLRYPCNFQMSRSNICLFGVFFLGDFVGFGLDAILDACFNKQYTYIVYLCTHTFCWLIPSLCAFKIAVAIRSQHQPRNRPGNPPSLTPP